MKEFNDSFGMIAKTFQGFETILADEISALGGRDILILNRAVKFNGDLKLLYKANHLLRTALRVIIPIDDFEVRNEDDLYKNVKKVNWNNYITPNKTLAVDSSINSSPFNHTNFVALKVKDAIVDRIREEHGSRPSIDTKSPDLMVNVHIFKNECTISLDSSGSSLHKRGYRQSQTDAPLNEVLAAGLILLTDWKADVDFYDPMCGSGTFTTEAFSIASGKPPRTEFKYGFMSWSNYEPELWKKVLRESKELIKPVKINFYASDISGKAVAVSKLNMRHPEMRKTVVISQEDFFNSEPKGDSGIIMLNPPYGERLKNQDIEKVYRDIGNKLKFDYHGFNAWILISSKQAEKSVGLKSNKKFSVLNGAIECKFCNFKLYSGSIKDRYAE
ncbi:MAG: class I SAM-dependent RNA methyltransferase [Candidatus Kapabacteria bacterium]|nr:class I SAM-dependent RNA methyltransferase [Ignavibacteriota bacterium]MCW5883522.1 class I SAM-dependent RNA methyltransferase [Candidatus Kapabacteria bacterium]